MLQIGIDIGSTATKVAVMDDEHLVDTMLMSAGFNSVDAAKHVADQLGRSGYDVAAKGKPTVISSMCTVFAESAGPLQTMSKIASNAWWKKQLSETSTVNRGKP